jgi:hypothetical protein
MRLTTAAPKKEKIYNLKNPFEVILLLSAFAYVHASGGQKKRLISGGFILLSFLAILFAAFVL